jgi:hypothetical protein
MSKEDNIKWGDGILKQISKSNTKTWTEVVEEFKNLTKEDIDKLFKDIQKEYIKNHNKGKDFNP